MVLIMNTTHENIMESKRLVVPAQRVAWRCMQYTSPVIACQVIRPGRMAALKSSVDYLLILGAPPHNNVRSIAWKTSSSQAAHVIFRTVILCCSCRHLHVDWIKLIGTPFNKYMKKLPVCLQLLCTLLNHQKSAPSPNIGEPLIEEAPVEKEGGWQHLVSSNGKKASLPPFYLTASQTWHEVRKIDAKICGWIFFASSFLAKGSRKASTSMFAVATSYRSWLVWWLF